MLYGMVWYVHGDCTLQFDCADENGDNDEPSPTTIFYTHSFKPDQGRAGSGSFLFTLFRILRIMAVCAVSRSCSLIFFWEGAAGVRSHLAI